MSEPLAAGLVHRLRRPGQVSEKSHIPGSLGAASVRFAGALTLRSLPAPALAGTGPVPGRTLAGAIRTEVGVHRLAQVHAAGSMVVPRDLIPLQAPAQP
jgi:hypothetical protein